MTQMGIVDRYEVVGLRCNPFAVVAHDSERAERLFVDRGLATPPAPGSKTLVQVIGDQGAGKTTHVQHWRRSMPGPYHYVPRTPYRQRWETPPVGPVVYADEIDRMPRPLRLQWFRRCAAVSATIVAGTHLDLAERARRCGLGVITHHVGPVERDTLALIIDRRLTEASCARTEGDRFHFSRSDIDAIFEKSAGALRVAEGLCHELLADRVR